MDIAAIVIAVFVYVNIIFLFSVYLKDYSIMDVAWGPGFVIVTSITWAFHPIFNYLRLILWLFIVIWATRLSSYIFLKKSGKEDWRYQNFRKNWGRHANLKAYFMVFILQGTILVLLSSTLIFLFKRRFDYWTVWTYVGLSISVIGFLCETVADTQMHLFKRKHKGQIMTKGLWNYSRHPNYFGEMLIWWGLYIICLNYTFSAWLVFSPVLITYLLVQVSGVKMLERKYKDDPEYQNYIKTTSAFIPWFKKR